MRKVSQESMLILIYSIIILAIIIGGAGTYLTPKKDFNQNLDKINSTILKYEVWNENQIIDWSEVLYNKYREYNSSDKTICFDKENCVITINTKPNTTKIIGIKEAQTDLSKSFFDVKRLFRYNDSEMKIYSGIDENKGEVLVIFFWEISTTGKQYSLGITVFNTNTSGSEDTQYLIKI